MEECSSHTVPQAHFTGRAARTIRPLTFRTSTF